MAPFVRVWFDEGQVRVEGDGERLGLTGRDAVRRSFTVAAADYARLRREAARHGLAVDDEVAPHLGRRRPPPGRRREVPAVTLDLLEALDARGEGAVRLPPGREREALVALVVSTSATGVLLVCADDASARGWRAGLIGWLDGAGFDPTVTALPRAVELLRRAGDRFGVVVVDEADRLDTTALAQALAHTVAPHRLALLGPAASEPAAPSAEASAGRTSPAPEPSAVEASTWPVVAAWTPGTDRQAGWLRLVVPLDEDEAREVAAARRLADGGRWLAALTTLTRRQRDKVRELIGRHPGVSVAVATPERPGLARPGLGALLDDLPLPARGELLARERDGTLRVVGLDAAGEWAPASAVVIVPGGPSVDEVAAVRGALPATGLLVELRVDPGQT